MLHFLYRTALGRLLLRPLVGRGFSRAAGAFLDTRASRVLIGPFVRKNGIDLSEYESDGFRCFNDCFCRQIKEGKRPIAEDPDALISPCDGLLRAHPITEGLVLPVKESRYAIRDLVGEEELAKRFLNGTCLVFRLCVHHYHRYAFLDDGTTAKPTFLPGRLHTVRPIALRTYPVFSENCRACTVIESDHFGTVAQIEVGAMLVGRICNHPKVGRVARGEEKGMFQYGGSTILVLLEEGAATVDPRFFSGEEIPVRFGEAIGKSTHQ